MRIGLFLILMELLLLVTLQSDFYRFCPDGVHPHSDSTGHPNKVIAGVYINALRGILYN